MPGFDGTGPMGMGPMTGGGRGFCSPWGVRAGWRRFDLPRWNPYTYPYYSPYGFGPLAPQMTREQELDFLKSEAQALRDELKELDTRISQLSTKEA
jgi:hypothetical protein